MMLTHEDARGTDFSWLGVDSLGHVAMFTTGGEAFVPNEFLSQIDAHYDAIQLIRSCEVVTVSLRCPDVVVGLRNVWREMVERGLFAFDLDPYAPDCSYVKVGVPVSSIRVESLHLAIRQIPIAVTGKVNFQEIERISELHFRR